MEINPCCMKQRKCGEGPPFFKAKMEALLLDPKRQTLTLCSLDVPAIVNPDDVIIRVAYAGVCGTDLHVINGDYPCSQQPFILGHEFCGVVYAVGSKVKTLKRGDRVAVDPNIGCGSCRYCHTASYHLCPTGSINSAIGIFYNGGWAQFCKVTANQVHLLPKRITFKQAALLEPLSCVYHGFSRISPIDFGKSILIAGAGIIGTLWCSLLHHIGHRKVFVSECAADRRELLKKLDTGFSIISSEEVDKNFSNDSVSGIDVCVDCTGNGAAIEQNFNLLNRGGELCIFGVAHPQTKISISPFDIFIKELTIRGVTVNPFTFQPSISIMEAMGSRYFDYERLGVQVYTMSEYKEALDALSKKTISKAVFRINGEIDC